MAWCQEPMVAEALLKWQLFEVAGSKAFSLDRFAVYDPQGPAAPLVDQVLPGLRDVLS